MKKSTRVLTLTLPFLPFLLWTALVLLVDRRTVFGDLKLGFYSLNYGLYDLLPHSRYCYAFSQFLALAAIAAVGFFGILGLVQLIKRKNLFKVDPDLLALGFLYGVMLVFYLIFNFLPINPRPAGTEQSYPSSHTLLALVVFGTAALQAARRIKGKKLRVSLVSACVLLSVLGTVTRLCSGKHWFTDIVGAILLAAALVCFYAGLVRLSDDVKQIPFTRK